MGKLMLASAAALTLCAVPAALSAQDRGGGPESAANTADANAQAQPAPSTTTVTTTPGAPATTTIIRRPAMTTVVQTPGSPAVTDVVRDNPGNLAPPPAESLNKTYPVCRRGQTDNCQNPGEGGAPGRSRALPSWPGKPASEGGH